MSERFSFILSYNFKLTTRPKSISINCIIIGNKIECVVFFI